MKKKLLGFTVLLAGVAALVMAPKLMEQKFHEAYQRQLEQLQAAGLVIHHQECPKKSWLGAQCIVEIELAETLGDQDESPRIRWVNRIEYGPFPWSALKQGHVTPLLAYIESQWSQKKTRLCPRCAPQPTWIFKELAG